MVVPTSPPCMFTQMLSDCWAHTRQPLQQHNHSDVDDEDVDDDDGGGVLLIQVAIFD